MPEPVRCRQDQLIFRLPEYNLNGRPNSLLHRITSYNVCYTKLLRSRSGRISTNYEGWHETILEARQMPQNDNYRLIEGSRVFEKHRITSYNVCYTKLLRGSVPASGASVFHLRSLIANETSLFGSSRSPKCRHLVRITSYNVCYTKLLRNLPMLSLKTHNLSWKDNWQRYIFLLGSAIILITLNIYGLAAVILFYILLNVIFYILKIRV